jgi:hypothetical protein
MNLLEINRDIIFDEPSHTYTNKEGKILTSATSLLSLYKESFDPTGIIATMCGKRKGITKDAMLAEWKVENDRSKTYGHSVHSQICLLYTSPSPRD